jgi:carboxyl-terminal processing protease
MTGGCGPRRQCIYAILFEGTERALSFCRPFFRVLMLAGLAVICAGPLRAQEEPPHDDVTRASLKFARVYSLIEQHYMGPLDPDSAILEGGVRGMLAVLDPFSAFFNQDQFELLKQQTEGKSVGFGTILYVTPGKVVILQTAPKSPSWRAGLGPGDQIVEINGQRIDRLDFRSLIELLKGARSRPVTLGVVRPGKVLPDTFKLNPAQVALPTVDRAFLFSPGIGYLHISGFEQKTPQEVMDAMASLDPAKLHGLLLDLRDNHGGLLDSAVATVSLFLKPGQGVLTLRGRVQPQKTYQTTAMPAHYALPLIVLVNGNTASAAEIVTAALEEHDRAVVAGEPTFGKGVVESVMGLSDKMGLAILTAQYFTPSGRCIQRPLPGTALAAPQESEQGGAGGFHTDDGRPLTAAGGVRPDVLIPDFPRDPWLEFLDARGIIANFASAYLTTHGRVSRSFRPDGQTLEEFRDFLTQGNVRSPEQYWQRDQAYLMLRIQEELFNLTFGLKVGGQAAVTGDPQVQKAVALFSEIPKLLQPPLAAKLRKR